MAKAEDENTISISCNDSFVEGGTYSIYVDLRTFEEISALSVEVHFDPDVIDVKNIYNSISATMYDSALHEDYISYSYILYSVSTTSSQRLFYFSSQIKNGVIAGNYYFDVVVVEAYNSSLENVKISTSRKNFSVTNKSSLKSTTVSSNKSSIDSSINEVISFTYQVNNTYAKSGTFSIKFDDELFEFVSLSRGNYFSGSIFDYNANGSSEILASFVVDSNGSNRELFTITLRVINNVNIESEITLNAQDLYDTDLMPMNCVTSPITVNLSYDTSYEEHPSMSIDYEIDYSNKMIDLTINLEGNSHLGAGDFVLTFNNSLLTYVSYEKKFNPTFFTVNDKQSQLEQGKVKFSILSTTDIIDEIEVITFTFLYEESKSDQEFEFGLTGSGLTDSLTETIILDISGVILTIDGIDFILRWANIYLHMDDPAFEGQGTGDCLSEGLYVLAKEELLKLDSESINDFATNADNKYTNQLARYMAWSRACHDSTPFEGAGIVLIANPLIAIASSENNLNWTVYFVATLLVSSITAFIILKKKRL